MNMKTFRKGATFIEYAMLVGLVAIVVAVAALFFGDKIQKLFHTGGKQTEKVQKVVDGAKLEPKVTLPSDPKQQ